MKFDHLYNSNNIDATNILNNEREREKKTRNKKM